MVIIYSVKDMANVVTGSGLISISFQRIDISGIVKRLPPWKMRIDFDTTRFFEVNIVGEVAEVKCFCTADQIVKMLVEYPQLQAVVDRLNINLQIQYKLSKIIDKYIEKQKQQEIDI